MNEIWKPVRGYEDFYAASDQGSVARTSTCGGRKQWKPIGLQLVYTGYGRYTLSAYNSRRDFAAHRLVWEAFNGPIPEGMQINHKNGVKTDNRIQNLEVCTQSENTTHAFRVLKVKPNINPNPGSKNGRAKLREEQIPQIVSLYRSGDFTQRQLADKFKISPTMISFIVNGKNWRASLPANQA